MNDDDDVPAELEKLFRTEREIDQVPSDAIERALERFEKSLPSGGGGGPASSGGGGAASAAGGFTAAHIAMTAAIAFTVGAGVGAALVVSLGMDTTTPPTRPEPVIALLLDAGAPVEEPALAPPAAIDAAVVVELAPRTALVEPFAVDAGVAESAPHRIRSSQPRANERALVDAARFALARGDTDAGLASVDAHRRRFPRGVLAEERDATEIQLLLRAGRREGARERARAFLEQYPTSLMRGTAQAALSGE
jgi:hypothetical protein